MNALKFYKFTALGLAILNLFIIGFFCLAKRPPLAQGSGGKNFRNKVAKILKLNENQKNKFLQSAAHHHSDMVEINHKQNEILIAYFLELANPNSINNQDSLLQENLTLEKQKIQATFEHLMELKSFLNAEQMHDYQVFISQFVPNVLLNSKK